MLIMVYYITLDILQHVVVHWDDLIYLTKLLEIFDG